MSQSSDNILVQDLSSDLRQVLKLALYIEQRYLKEESAQFCSFDQNPEVLQNIREKYKYMADNLDQFLFEFMRPCIEALLAPVYQEFLNSQIFNELARQMEMGEVFEWMLSIKQV